MKQTVSKYDQYEAMSETMILNVMLKVFHCLLIKAELHNDTVQHLTLDAFQKKVNPIFIYSIMWSIGVTVLDDQRKTFDKMIRRIVSDPIKCDNYKNRVIKFDKNIVPPESGGTLIIEYDLDLVDYKWTHMREDLANFDNSNEMLKELSFYDLFIETLESLRIKKMLAMSVENEFPLLLIGPTGIGKTQLIQSYLRTFKVEDYMTINLSFSARTSSNNVQSIIDGKVEKKRRDTFGPPLFGQKGIIYIDDLNLPLPDKYTYQPPLELIRQF